MDIVNGIIEFIINPLIYLLIGVAVIYFLFGVFKFIQNGDKPEERTKGAQHIIWGVIGIAIIFSAFTFVHIIMNTLGSGSAHPSTLP